jgi:hypothetical protein
VEPGFRFLDHSPTKRTNRGFTVKTSDTFAGGQPTGPKASAHPAPLSLASVPFRGGHLLAAQVDGEVFVPLLPLCDTLGVSLQGQLAKLRAKPWATIKMILSVAGDGKARQLAAVDLRSLPLWLATIEPSRVRPEAREALVAYQREAADVLYRHFLAPPSDDMPSARWRRSIEAWLERLERKYSKNEARETKGARVRRLEAENARLREAAAALPVDAGAKIEAARAGLAEAMWALGLSPRESYDTDPATQEALARGQRGVMVLVSEALPPAAALEALCAAVAHLRAQLGTTRALPARGALWPALPAARHPELRRKLRPRVPPPSPCRALRHRRR